MSKRKTRINGEYSPILVDEPAPVVSEEGMRRILAIHRERLLLQHFPWPKFTEVGFQGVATVRPKKWSRRWMLPNWPFGYLYVQPPPSL